MTLYETCDIVLKFALYKREKTITYYPDAIEISNKNNIPFSDVHQALVYLSSESVKYLDKRHNGEIYALTPPGEKFIRDDGYKGEAKRKQEQEIKSKNLNMTATKRERKIWVLKAVLSHNVLFVEHVLPEVCFGDMVRYEAFNTTVNELVRVEKLSALPVGNDYNNHRGYIKNSNSEEYLKELENDLFKESEAGTKLILEKESLILDIDKKKKEIEKLNWERNVYRLILIFGSFIAVVTLVINLLKK